MSEFTMTLWKTKRANATSGVSDGYMREGEFARNPHAVCIVKDNFRLSANLTERRNGNIYCEQINDPHSTSFVISFGWCYRCESRADRFEEKAMFEFLQSHRSKPIPDVDVLSGIYTLLSYDHISETLWICTDMWAQHGFYYGSDDSKVVVSSKASIVAEALNASIDGVSYLSLLRDTGIPPGRTLYSDVWRVTCGRALHVDLKNRTARTVQMQPLYRVPQNITFDDAVDQLIDVLVRVCPSAASGPSTVVDLTGGNDSRLMAAALSSSQGGRIGKQVTFKVVGEEDLSDVMIARQIANKFGWNLQRMSRWNEEEAYSAKSLLEASILSDGNFLPRNVHRRRTQELKYSSSLIGHVGSLGGELFRDFFWRHEFLKMGRTNRVNFDALLKHRLYASNDVDVACISDGQLTLHDHNLSLLSPYQAIASAAPDLENVYKLDVIYLHKLMSRSYCWVLSDMRKLILPFLSHEITLASLRTPWRLRLHRRLVTAAVMKMSPTLSAIPTDAGAPMRPLRLSSAGSYSKYVVLDVWSAYKRHFSSKTPVQKQIPSSIPSEWLDVFEENWVAKSGGNIPLSMKKPRVLDGGELSVTQHREIEALLLVQTLTQHYKGISPSLSFNGKNASFTNTTYQL